MKTTDLIGLLASDTLQTQQPVKARLRKALLTSSMVCGVLLLTAIGLNPDIGQMALHPSFITKMIWLTTLMGLSFYSLLHLSRPGMHAAKSTIGIGLTFVAMLVMGLLQWIQTDVDARAAQWMGGSWEVCSVSIMALSLPILGALVWALRHLAPTRPVLAGTVAGMLAGSLASGIYSFHCTETSLTFFAAWYAAGMIVVSALGGVLGKRFLRW